MRVLARELGMLDARFNIVLMGMGEPLHNYDATMKALRMLADEHGFAMSPRRITLSTVGVLPALERLAHRAADAEPGDLAARDDRGAARSARADQPEVPVSKELLDACRRFPLKRRERITFEYVMLAGRERHAGGCAAAGAAAARDQGKVNLLPLNEAPGIPFERPSDERVNRFAQDPRRARHDGVGAQEPRPRHPRRLRSADHGVDAEGARRAACRPDAVGSVGISTVVTPDRCNAYLPPSKAKLPS